MQTVVGNGSLSLQGEFVLGMQIIEHSRVLAHDHVALEQRLLRFLVREVLPTFAQVIVQGQGRDAALDENDADGFVFAFSIPGFVAS